jgi:non-specific serine/threonine protein kinase
MGFHVALSHFFNSDWNSDAKYVVLKIHVTGERRTHELDVYHCMNSVESSHPGKRFIRKLFDHFLIKGPHGQHVCLVHEPLGVNASELLKVHPGPSNGASKP